MTVTGTSSLKTQIPLQASHWRSTTSATLMFIKTSSISAWSISWTAKGRTSKSPFMTATRFSSNVCSPSAVTPASLNAQGLLSILTAAPSICAPFYEGNLYVTCDEGDADEDAPDSLYRVDPKSGEATLERSFDDVTRQGEIEGLTFDAERRQFLLLYNRGARIVLGMPKGFYDGYTEEIHEVFVYEINK